MSAQSPPSFVQSMRDADDKAFERMGEMMDAEESATSATPEPDPEPTPEPEPAPEPVEKPESDVEVVDEETQEETAEAPDEESHEELEKEIERLEKEHRDFLRGNRARSLEQPPQASPTPIPTPPTKDSGPDLSAFTENEKFLHRRYEEVKKALEESQSFQTQLRQKLQHEQEQQALADYKRHVLEISKKYPDVFDGEDFGAELARSHLLSRVLYETNESPELAAARIAMQARKAKRSEVSKYVKGKIKQAKSRTVSGGGGAPASRPKKDKPLTSRDWTKNQGMAVIDRAFARMKELEG